MKNLMAMDNLKGSEQSISMKQFSWPRTVISRFTIRRTLRSGILWALVFGGYVAAKGIGYVDAYTTPALRLKVAEAFTKNSGIEVILGSAKHVTEVSGYIAWNTGGIMVIVGSIWALLLVTKLLRGEESAGRWELLLLGRTTARRATINVLSGIGVTLTVFYAIISGIFALIGKNNAINFNTSAALFFGLTVVSGILMFMLVGALASQLLPTRSGAASLTALVLGVSFLFRAVADTTSATWLLNITPLGWVEKLSPLDTSRSLWLIPIGIVTILLTIATVYLAGKRDLGDSIFAEKATAKPRTKLLNSPLAAAVRLTRTTTVSWLTAIGLSAILYGALTKTAVQAFNQSAGVGHRLGNLEHTAAINSAQAFLGIVFFLQMILIMAYAASAISALRKDESEGYLDNLLVRPVGRTRLFLGRILLILTSVAAAGLITALGTWLSTTSQHLGVPFYTLLKASVNSLAPVILTLGIGALAFGFRPRLTSIVAYGVLVWSFLVDLLSSGVNLNHWIKDTSLLNQVTLAPATNPNWHIVLIMFGLGMALILFGATRFHYRDLENE
ncbi:MAG TPA: hypothetical protein VMR28_03260 [Candidatus Saccharimonadales bacterium]|nr:hypothetical protein [Candidatus Saccharimonadales bacterium]